MQFVCQYKFSIIQLNLSGKIRLFSQPKSEFLDSVYLSRLSKSKANFCGSLKNSLLVLNLSLSNFFTNLAGLPA